MLVSTGLPEAEEGPDLWIHVMRFDETERLIEGPLSACGIGNQDVLSHVGVGVEQGRH